MNDVDRVRAQELGVALLYGFTVLLASVVIGVLTVLWKDGGDSAE